MSRRTLRQAPTLEQLEIRQVLSGGVGTTNAQQYALEVINLVRTNPAAAGQTFTANLSPDIQATLSKYGLSAQGLQSELDSAKAQPPVAWSDSLARSATSQSQYEAANGVQTHTGANGSNLSDRITAAGYGNFKTAGENTYAYAESVDEAMQSFLFDWGQGNGDHGHYNNLVQPGTSAGDSYRDVGVGLVTTPTTNGVGPLVITQDFGSQPGEAPQVVGSVFKDAAGTRFYAEGEGQGGVTIDAVNQSTGQDYQALTGASGGYQVPVAPNADYKVTATQDGQVVATQGVHVSADNVQVEFPLDPSATPPAQAPVQVQAQVQAPAPTPAPAPVATPAPSPSPSNILATWTRWNANTTTAGR